MKYIHGTTEFHIEEECVLSLGKFDGLHRGHETLLEHMMEQKNKGCATVLFTFAIPPRPGRINEVQKVLTTNEEKVAICEEQGIDYLIEYPFTKEVMTMEPEAFIEMLASSMKIRGIVVGTDFHFGYQRRGDHAMLQKLAPKYGYTVEVVEKEQSHGRDISSTYIREALHDGNVKLANELLGYRYYVSGIVLHGRQIGRTIGMPTTNLLPPQEKLLPKDGVYLTRTFVKEDEYYGITNVGYKPTVGGETRRGVETYLFDFDGDLYGQDLMVEFIEFRRPEQKFQSLDELKAHILSDMNWGKSVARQI